MALSQFANIENPSSARWFVWDVSHPVNLKIHVEFQWFVKQALFEPFVFPSIVTTYELQGSPVLHPLVEHLTSRFHNTVLCVKKSENL
jgi:hypothetical protein